MGRHGGGGGAESLHVVMFPWFAVGHINPFLQMANKLAAHGVRVSFLSAPGNIPRISSSLNDAGGLSTVVPVPIPAVSGLPPEVQTTAEATFAQAELLKLATDQMGPQLEAVLDRLRPDFIFFDFCMHWLPPLARRRGFKAIFFTIFNAISGAYLMVPSRLPQNGRLPGPDDLKLPPPGLESPAVAGMTTFEANDLQYAYKSFGGPSVYDRVTACLRTCDAIVDRTCLEMESTYVNYLESHYQKPVLLAGPLPPEPPAGELDRRWADWLSTFPAKSVIYCALGSENFLPDDQIKELVSGLEMTGFPFLLVLHSPGNGEARPKEVLPEGVSGRGVVHTGWVQQQLVLAHPSVGCFVSHAGWSSVMEGLLCGLQFVLLPVKGDQFFNARLLSEELHVGVRVNRREEDGFFTGDEVCDAVKRAMATEKGKEWTEFLRDKEKQEGFTRALIETMKEISVKATREAAAN